MDLSHLRFCVEEILSKKRFEHTLSCEGLALKLSKRWGANEEYACAAALLHDVTKELDREAQLQLFKRYDIVPDEITIKVPALWHAITAALLAEHVYGMPDEVVGAIRWHTTGHAEMTVLEKIVFLADYAEPGRTLPDVQKIREKSFSDLDGALIDAMMLSCRYIEKKGAILHPDTKEAIKSLCR